MDLSLLQQFGSELRAAREASGRSVDEIARQTRIHRRYIEAIEAGDGAALPPGPYVPAFLREFARAVGLKVPAELALTSSINHGLTTATVQSAPIVKNAQGNPFSAVGKAADETAKFAGNVAKTAVKTTGTVIKGVGEGINDTAGFLTSRSLREEAEMVRRERLGLTKFSDRESEQEAVSEQTIVEAPITTEAVVTSDATSDTQVVAPTFERLSETQGKKPKVVKAPMLPLEISSEDPIAGDATLKLGKSSKKFPVTNLVILLLLIAFGLVAYFAIGNMRDKKRGDIVQSTELTNEQDLPTAAASTPDPTPAVDESKPTVTAPAITNDSLQFTLKANDVVWVSIGSDDANPFRGEMKAGETKTFAAADRFTVNLGNQKALEMTFNGTRLSNLPTIKNSGMVVRNLVLTKDRVSLNGAEVSTTNTIEPAAPVVQKPAVTKTAVKTTATPTKTTTTTTVKKPATTATKSATTKTTTTSTVKKPLATTTTKKPVVKKKPSPTLIPSVEPKPAEAD